jgi:prepilin-type N-terminal cleavage/methylation domain-containing protein
MQATRLRRIASRRARRGFSLLEIIVAIAIIAMVSAGVTVAIVGHFNKAKITTTKTNAQSIRSGIKAWWLENDGSTCPDVKILVADGAIDRGKKVAEDAWGQPWRIVCEQNDVTIISKGPDKLPDTEDDIRVPAT